MYLIIYLPKLTQTVPQLHWTDPLLVARKPTIKSVAAVKTLPIHFR